MQPAATAVSDSPPAGADVADGLARRHGHRDRNPVGRLRGRREVRRPRHPDHDDATAARCHGLGPVRCPVVVRLAPDRLRRRDASGHARRPDRCRCHQVHHATTDAALGPACGDQHDRPRPRRPGPNGRDVVASRPGPSPAAPASRVHRCSGPARQRARCQRRARRVPSPTCWAAPPDWGRVPGTTGTTRSPPRPLP